jgi:hypothetical protein
MREIRRLFVLENWSMIGENRPGQSNISFVELVKNDLGTL